VGGGGGGCTKSVWRQRSKIISPRQRTNAAGGKEKGPKWEKNSEKTCRSWAERVRESLGGGMGVLLKRRLGRDVSLKNAL